MHKQPIEQKTKQVLEKIARQNFFKKFYLAGGTALAILFEHRQSIDLDWFSNKIFSNQDIKEQLKNIGNFEITKEDTNTLHCLIDEVKTSFFLYPYENIYPLKNFEGIKLADERDISAMKIDAISSRGSKKDFIDLYFLMEKYDLEDILNFFSRKYHDIKYNKVHILKSLTYFETAEKEPMPKMIEDIKWEDIKKDISKKVHIFLKKQTK